MTARLEHPLAPAYVVSGEEPLQSMEAGDAIRAAARAQGYTERHVIEAAGGFDWRELQTMPANLSLFAQRMLLDVRLPSAQPGAQGARALAGYAEQPPMETLLLLSTGKLDRAAMNSAWFKALDRIGVVVQVWPLSAPEMIRWVEARMRARDLHPEPEAVRLLAARAEGNLLAAAQEVEKLSLLCDGSVSAADVMATAADSARFSVFDLSEAALAGDMSRVVSVMNTLRAEGEAPALVLWALTDQIRQLTVMSHQREQGRPLEAVTQGVWHKRKPAVKRALTRVPHRGWNALLRRCAEVDAVIKGLKPGREWDELLQLALGVCRT